MTRLPPLLAAGNFVVGLAAFVVIGIVSPIAGAFRVSHGEAGQVMTWYAVAYMVGAPLATALTGRASRRLVLAGGLLLVALGSLASALAPTLLLLDLSRILPALGAGLFTPGAAAVTVATAPPERRAGALSTVFAGMTLAQVMGVPAGTWLGYALGFQAIFWIVAALSVTTAIILYVAMPADLAFQPTSLKALGRTLASPPDLAAVLFTATLMTGVYVVYTFFGPLIEARYGYGRDGVTIFLLLFGVAAVFGNLVGGFAADRAGPSRTLTVICVLQAILLPTVAALPMPPVALAVVTVVWSLAGWSFMTPQQARLVAAAPERAAAMLSLNASAIYLGVALGSAAGGLALHGGGWPMVAATAGVTMVLALAHLIGGDRLVKSARRRAGEPSTP